MVSLNTYRNALFPNMLSLFVKYQIINALEAYEAI